ncbi:MAG TPA: response regulator transcription factor [Sporichthyaceae bacterium]|jgi:DNA-binding response OmpR family regulator
MSDGPSARPRLLLIENDEAIGRQIEAVLTAAGHQVVWERTGAAALIAAAQGGFALILLDLGVPNRAAVEVCRGLRTSQPDCVLVVLAARRDEMDVVVGLDAGADDCIIKPFGLTELIARVRAHLRRASAGAAMVPEVFIDGDLVLDVAARRCTVAGQEVPLRTKEFDLFVRLVRSTGEAVSRTTLMVDVWDANWYGSSKTLDVHVASVRRRLAAVVARTGVEVRMPGITTMRGYGYRVDPAPNCCGRLSTRS